MTILDFTEDIKCEKCGFDEKFSCEFCFGGDGSDECPQTPHHHLECSRCGYSWYMLSAEVDIEQEFNDLDQFSNVCPKCKDTNLAVRYCEEPSTSDYRCRNEIDKMDVDGEHLHVKCNFCGYKWNSVVANHVEVEEAPPDTSEHPLPEVKEADPA